MSLSSTGSVESGRKRKRTYSVEIGDEEREELATVIEEHHLHAKVLRSLLENKDSSYIPQVCWN